MKNTMATVLATVRFAFGWLGLVLLTMGAAQAESIQKHIPQPDVFQISVTEKATDTSVCDPVLDPTCVLPDPINPGGGGIDFSTIFTVGQRIWDFVVTNKPTATYEALKASVLPGGTTKWTQLTGWSRPVSKVYRVELKNILGRVAGSFEYRIVFVYGGNYQGKGKYIGQISFVPVKLDLKTGFQLNVHAELLDPLNFGTEEDPIAGAQLLITWSSPSTFRYQMNSIEYFLYGTGEVQDISNGSIRIQ